MEMSRLAALQVLFLYLLHFCLMTRSDELEALLKIKNVLTNSRSGVLDTWIPGRSPCSFSGILCNELNMVIQIVLPEKNLDGSLPLDYICQLEYLKRLNFESNQLHGNVSEDLQYCRKLEYLELATNLFTGPFPWRSIEKLTDLSFLSIGDNYWEKGQFPIEVLNLKKLYYLYLGNCTIQGQIPPGIGELVELEYLDLSANSLSGSIPIEIGKLRKVKQFHLWQNRLSGTLPLGFRNLTKLLYLDISGNQLEGNLNELRFLDNINTLHLYANSFSGQVPEEFGYFKYIVDISLYSNMLTGPLPQKLGSWADFVLIDVHDNMLSGPIPPDMCKMGKLEVFLMGYNKFSDGIPESYASCSSLRRLRVENNSLTGSIPTRFWGLPNVYLMDLSSNKFEGPIASSIGEARSLNQLLIQRNQFSGEIPVEILNASSLSTIDISFNKFSCEIPRNIGELKNLNVINFEGNPIFGTIPYSIGLCASLTSINLRGNLLTGAIPTSIGSLKLLRYVDISSNKLSGPVPSNLLSLGPSMLNLSNNHFASSSHHARSDSKLVPILIISALGLGVLSLIVTKIYGKDKCKLATQEPVIQGSQELVELVYMRRDLIFGYEDIMRVTEDLSERFEICSGNISKVYKCELIPKAIAIKRYYDTWDLKNTLVDAEIQTLGKTTHLNIVKLHGYCLSPKGVLLFLEYMQNGSLSNHLHGGSHRLQLNWDKRLNIAIGVANGLAYLHHGCDPSIVHRDVNSSNILLDENCEACLSDFGLARHIPSSASYVLTDGVEGTIGYTDPEYVRTSCFNKHSDVYSFGIVLLELLTGSKAVKDGINLQELISLKVVKNTEMECVDTMVSDTCPDLDLTRKAFVLAMRCTQGNRFERPTMMEVARDLHDLVSVGEITEL